MKRAKVLFTNGFNISPTVSTDDADLFARLSRLREEKSVAEAATKFVLHCAAKRHQVTIHNAPEGATFGGTLTMLENEAFWPADGSQAGVFLVYLETAMDVAHVDFWGGEGFEGTPEFTKKIPQRRDFVES